MMYRSGLYSLFLLGLVLGLNTATLQAQTGLEGNKPAEKTPVDIEEQYAKDSTTEINVKNADIAAIVRIFSKKTKRNYILDEKVAGKVSIYLPGKVSTDESISILDSVLALKGFAAVPIGENLWKIIPAKDAKQSTIPTMTETSANKPGAAMVTRLHQLKYVAAEDMKNLIQPLISPDGLINAYTGTNSLIIIDVENNIERLIRLASELDVPFSDREMTIIPIKHADAPDIATKLQDILALPKESGSGTSSASAVDSVRSRLRDNGDPQRAAAGSAGVESVSAKSSPVSARSREPKIIADERTNSVIVVADEDTTARIRALVDQLDSEIDLSGHRYYVYHCRHADAEELANVLSGLVGGEGSSSSSSRSGSNNNEGLSGGDQISGSRNNSSSRSQSRLESQRRTPGQSRNQGNQNSGVSSVKLSEDLSITADPATNSLIINSSKADYEKVKSLLQELDIKRRQVLVEAMLLEVTVTDSENFGTDFITSAGGSDGGVLAQSNFGSLESLFANPTAISGFSVAAASAGSLKLPGITIPTQTILLQAARMNQNVNVLSAPNILATDNEQAEIVVGENVPFLASTSSSNENLSNTFNQIDRQDVGITLRLTPQISSEDFVTLNIFTEVSAVVSATAASELGPTTTVRTSETTVITKDSQMVVIGGLMADKANRAEEGVPFFKDIPVLGSLFRSSRDEGARTNLLIFITPRIIKDQYDARDVSLAHSDDMRSDIATQGLTPDREEILENPSLHAVTERTVYEGTAPSTILPPENKPKVRIESADNSAAMPSSQTESDNVIELRVKPKIPNSGSNNQLQRGPAASMKSTTAAAGDRFVVLDFSGNAPELVPFSTAQNGKAGRFGVVVPGNSSSKALDFFGVGKNYNYGAGDSPLSVQAVGVFSSAEEALAFYPDLPNRWYTLSPHEIMNLGRAPWRMK